MGKLNIDGDLTGIERCPHCNIATPSLRQTYKSPLYQEPDTQLRGRIWASYQCTTCTSLVLVKCKPSLRPSLATGWRENLDMEVLFPQTRTVDEALPPAARTYLTQAHSTLHAPDAAAVMAASAVDAMLKDKGYKEGSLYTRIDKAVEDHILTDGMGKWAHAVRLEANNVRHADEESPHLTKEQAEQVVEFTWALGDFLYVLTAKIAKGVEAAKPPTKIEKKDGTLK